MQSRRDCKRDSRFDRLLQQLYGDLQGFEAQVLIYILLEHVLRGARRLCRDVPCAESWTISAHCRAHL